MAKDTFIQGNDRRMTDYKAWLSDTDVFDESCARALCHATMVLSDQKQLWLCGQWVSCVCPATVPLPGAHRQQLQVTVALPVYSFSGNQRLALHGVQHQRSQGTVSLPGIYSQQLQETVALPSDRTAANVLETIIA